jgi:hypothetical protein
VNTALIDALRNGIAHDNPIDPLGIWQVPSDSANGLSGSCLPSIDEQCSWDAFKTLALCYSREDVTHHIILEDDDVSLSAFSGFHQKFERYAAFRSRVHGYTNGTGTTVFPATSVSNGTNLPNLAEIYYLFYDPCADPNAFNKSNITHWKAYKGTFQFCIQTLNASKVSTSNNGATTMTLINSRVDLNWNATTRDGGSTFCTIVNGEETEFCVSEPLMKKLAIHINRIFNATADFSESDHSNDIYNTEWGPLLIKQLYKYCGDSHSAFIWGFQDTLEGVTHSLTNKYARLTPLLNALPFFECLC